MHDTHLSLRSGLSVGRMLDAAAEAPKAAFGGALDEVRSKKGALRPNDVEKILHLAAVMVCQEGIPSGAQRDAMAQLAMALGGTADMVPAALEATKGKKLADVV